MDLQFWLDRWREGQIGFHREGVHPDLLRWGEDWLGGTDARVLVPLCGKSQDLPWLAARAREVVGVELSELAVQALVQEHHLDAERHPHGPYEAWSAGTLHLWVGDVFALDPARDGRFDRVWDRGALVALDPPRRARYVARLRELLAPGGEVLLNFFWFDAEGWQGPPHNVPEDEVRALYAGAEITVLQDAEQPLEEKFAARGARSFRERTWRIRLPPA